MGLNNWLKVLAMSVLEHQEEIGYLVYVEKRARWWKLFSTSTLATISYLADFFSLYLVFPKIYSTLHRSRQHTEKRAHFI